MSLRHIGLTLASLALAGSPAPAGHDRCGTPTPASYGVVVVSHEYRSRSTYSRLISEGWTQIELECYADAQRLFSRATRLRPYEGEAHVGYSLASALCGDERAAAWAMREAFERDPRGVRAPRSGAIDDALCELRDRYRLRCDRFPSGRRAARDEAFMLASVAFLMGDDREARRAVETAIDLGDRSDAAYNLLRMVRGRGPCD